MTKALITLAKALDFNDEVSYFDYCIDSHINGNHSQCKELFKAMKIKDRKALINYCNEVNQQEIAKFYLNLI